MKRSLFLIACLIATVLASMPAIASASEPPIDTIRSFGVDDVVLNNVQPPIDFPTYYGSFQVRDPQTGGIVNGYCADPFVPEPPVEGNVAQAPIVSSPGIDYLLWRYARPGAEDLTSTRSVAIAWYVWRDLYLQTGRGLTVADPTYSGPAQIAADYAQLRDEASRFQAPWTVVVSASDWSGSGPSQVTVKVVSATGNNVPNIPVNVTVANGSGSGIYNTGPNGNVALNVTPTDRFTDISVRSTAAGPGAARQLGTDAERQRVLIAGDQAEFVGRATAGPTNATASIAKTTDNPAYQDAAGAQFSLILGGEVQGVLTVKADGSTTPIEVQPGVYTVSETFTPAWLEPVADFQVTLEPGGTYQFSVENDARRETVVIRKSDGDTGSPLSDATFSLAFDSDDDGVFETELGTFSTVDGAVEVAELYEGWYRVTELAPPPKYTLPEVQQVDVYVAFGKDNQASFEDLIPELSTQAQEPVVTIGAELTDKALLEKVASTTEGEITFVLYGPFPSEEAISCRPGYAYGRGTVKTVGSGTYISPPVKVTESGLYTWVATWTGSDKAVATHDCGEATETVIVNPTISTEALFPEIEVGAATADHVTLGGRKKTSFTGDITVEMFGPFDRQGLATCAGNPTWAYISDIRGDDDFSTSVAPTQYGWYTFQATFRGDEGTYVQDECGAAEEWVKVLPTLTSQVSTAKLTVGEEVKDTVNVRGVPAGHPGTITWKLFGPFNSAEQMNCSGQAVASGIQPVNGGQNLAVGSFSPKTAGWYTYDVQWSSASGLWAAGHECGIPSESFFAAPDIASEASPRRARTTETLADRVTLAGLSAGVQGRLSVSMFGPYEDLSAATCQPGELVDTQTAETSGSGDTNVAGFSAALVGHYAYVVGWDGNGLGDEWNVTEPCRSTGEDVLITKWKIDIVTQAHTPVLTGETIWDDALVTFDGPRPGGKVTFELFGPGDPGCRHPIARLDAPMDGSARVSSPKFTVPQAGEYRWVESYSGDNNYEPHRGKCGAVNESSFVTGPAVGPPATPLPTTPAPVTTPPAPAPVARVVAFTGSSSAAMAMGAAALILAGGLILLALRRRSAS